MRKYAIPSASRIDALSGSRDFAFSRATVACAARPLARCSRPCWKRSKVSLIRSGETPGSPVSPLLASAGGAPLPQEPPKRAARLLLLAQRASSRAKPGSGGGPKRRPPLTRRNRISRSSQVGKVLLHQVKRVRQISRLPDRDLGNLDARYGGEQLIGRARKVAEPAR